MKYDFETILDRHGMDSLAIDGPGTKDGFCPDAPGTDYPIIPMWVADMNFKTAPSVVESIRKRLEHPNFGYFRLRPEYYNAIKEWNQKRNGTLIQKEDVRYDNGVLGALSSTLRAFTSPGEEIFLLSPCYIGFLGTLKSLGRVPAFSALTTNASGRQVMDYEDCEKVIREHRIHFAVLCSPHNPAGRVWEKEELVRFAEICEKYEVTVFADEIWSDLILTGKHIPFFTVSDYARTHTVTAYAPSKTFSIAGIVGAYRVIFDQKLRDRVDREAALTHYNDPNVLSQYALIGGYSKEGEEWLEELLTVLRKNVNLAYDFLSGIDGVTVAKPEGTYMMYPLLTDYLNRTGRSFEEVLHAGWKVGVVWQDGRPFQGQNAIRLNLAVPTSQLEEAIDRFTKYVF